jgi:Hint domain
MGMATYRLGFYGFDVLAPGGGEAAGSPLSGAIAGMALRLRSPGAVLTSVLVATDVSGAPAAQIVAGSDFGVEGQAVSLGRCLSLVGDDDPSHRLTGHVLSLDGRAVGLLAAAPLRPGVAYALQEAGDPGPGEHIRALLPGLDPTTGTDAPPGPQEAVFCFTPGTKVDTPDGPRLVEALRAGDLVTTLGNGSQVLRWIGRRQVSLAALLMSPELRPVEFAAGVIGNLGPLRVSPQHRVLLNDWRAQVYFGEDEVLIPAKAMINGQTIRQVLPPEGVTYLHLLFDRHEIIVTDGALSESFHPGETGLEALDAAQRREVDLLFPGLELARRRAAFPIVKLTEARALRLPD